MVISSSLLTSSTSSPSPPSSLLLSSSPPPPPPSPSSRCVRANHRDVLHNKAAVGLSLRLHGHTTLALVTAHFAADKHGRQRRHDRFRVGADKEDYAGDDDGSG
jgi:hypothetical protein